MNTKNLLDQLLRAGNDMLQNNSHPGRQSHHTTPSDRANSYSDRNSDGANPLLDGLSSFLSGRGGAAAAGGALGLLLGSKSGRKMGGKVLTYGGLAVMGTLAYKAYQNYQRQSHTDGQRPVQPLDQLPSAQAEKHCKAILVALIAASKADGHVDDRERQLIDSEVAKLNSDPELQHWFDRELKKPLDPVEVARHSESESMAAEMYMASLLTVDQQNFMEKTYLEELARQLKLPAALQAELVQQVNQVTGR